MKKTIIIASALFLFFTAAVNAQQTEPAPAKPSTDQWNNHNPEKYKLQPMPEAITLEKKFPVIGKYNLADKSGTASEVSITLDETNKGMVWVEGLPQGKFRALLLKAPGSYKIPVQEGVDGKKLPEGVMIFDKDNNTLDVCIGCAYNIENPASAFAAAEPVAEEPAKPAKKTTAKSKAKTTQVKTWKYSGSKIVETTASVAPAQQ